MTSDVALGEDAQPAHEPSTSAEDARSIRAWPGLVLSALAVACVLVPGFFVPGTLIQFMGMTAGPLLCGVMLVAWWVVASRVPFRERVIFLLGFVLLGGIAIVLAHPSMPLMLVILGWPGVVFAGSLWLAISNNMRWPARGRGLWCCLIAGWAAWTLVRCDGVDGQVLPEFSWRWTPTAEEKYLAALEDMETADVPAGDIATANPNDWPEFRGPGRRGHALSTTLNGTDWNQKQPQEVWRRAIGPGWSSFSVVDGRLFTQEQRGELEVVLCLDAKTGKQIWAHEIEARFYEFIGGAGPRATPTYHDQRIYTLGANGYFACLSASDGAVIWKRDLVKDGNTKIPTWGFSSSPLVVGDLVVVFGGGGKSNSLLAYDLESGKLAWSAGKGTHSYSSPQLEKIDDVDQILMTSDLGISSHAPSDGNTLWEHAWEIPGGYRVVQPNAIDDQVLIGTNNGMGTRALKITQNEAAWNAKELWTSTKLKPYFNDFVIHKQHVYGFDNKIFVCIDLANGDLQWKGGRYGTGQLLLFPEQDLILVTTEKTGEVVLLEANPEKHVELTRFKAISGKTWNHPAISGQHLFVRNGQEAACFVLP